MGLKIPVSVVRFHLWPPELFADSALINDFLSYPDYLPYADKSSLSHGPPLGPRNLRSGKIEASYGIPI